MSRPKPRTQALAWLVVTSLYALPTTALAHGVTGPDQLFIEQSQGFQGVPFAYLGAKHMVTGYDHLLFLVGVIFYLFRMREVATFVTLFSIGHSTTLLLGVLTGIHINAFLVDAVIGLSVVYKGLDNLRFFKRTLGFQPNPKVAVLGFGLIHGFGLATKLQDFSLSPDGLIPNIVCFNLGVEVGQLLALGIILIGMGYWRRTEGFSRHAKAVNGLLILAGLALTAMQLWGFALEAS